MIEIPNIESSEDENEEVKDKIKEFKENFQKQEEKKKPLIPVNVIKKKKESEIIQNIFPSEKDTIYISSRQKNNPILEYISNIKFQFKENILPDFIIGQNICIYFISLKYHLNHKDYIKEKIKKLGNAFSLRVILCKIDSEDYKGITDLNQLCYLGDCTLILSFNDLECARYIETFKIYEKKSAQLIQPKIENEYLPRLQDILTSIKSINKTDTITLSSNFGSLKSIMNASIEELSICPGLGQKKVKRLHDIFNVSFKK